MEEDIEGVPVITRPKPSHLENMTQALLSDLASQSQQIRDLTTEVQGLKRGAVGVDMQAMMTFTYHSASTRGFTCCQSSRPHGLLTS